MFIFSIHILEGKTLTMVGWSYVYLYVQCICTFWYIFWWCYFCLYFQCICTFLSICICVLFRSTLTTRTVRKPRWSLGRIALVSGAANNTTWQLLEITSESETLTESEIFAKPCCWMCFFLNTCANEVKPLL